MTVPKDFADKEVALIKQLSNDKKSIEQIRTELNLSRCQLCKERHYGICIAFSERAIGFKLFKTGVITKKQLDSHLNNVETRKKEVKNEKRKGIEKKRTELLQQKKLVKFAVRSQNLKSITLFLWLRMGPTSLKI